jgi:UDP-N-acetylglucosamine transferase subunit ALG13
VVVCHSGVGSALEALDAGHSPILVPRRRAHGEHIDDHQLQVAADLERRGLALVRDPGELSTDDLFAAARRSVRAASSPPRLELSR